MEEWLSIARQWKYEKEIAEGKSTTPTRGGVGKWDAELLWELWELILDSLSAVDRLSCVTSTKGDDREIRECIGPSHAARGG